MKAALILGLLVSAGAWASTPDDLVSVQSFPASPTVFTSSMTRPNGDIIPPNWFSFALSINNQNAVTDATHNSVTIAAVHVEVTTGPGAGTYNIDFAPSYDNQGSCMFLDFGQFDANGLPLQTVIGKSTSGPFPDSGVNNDRLFSIPTLKDGSCGIESPIFYVGGLPDLGNGNFTYDVQIQLIGWYGDRQNQRARFTKTINLKTQ